VTGSGSPAGPRRLQGRVGVVTGAGRGIGREVSRALAEQGMGLLLLSRTGSELRSLAAELDRAYGVPVLPAVVDVTDAAALDRVVAHAEQQLGPVDLLVNNAARVETTERPFWEADPEELWGIVETNLRGPMLLCRSLLPPMVQRGHGHVVNLTSRARAATRNGTYTGYAVSKRALSLLTETLALSLRGTGVVVVGVLPGLVRTPMTEAMPVWRDVPDDGWSPASATSQVVVDVALGVYDDRGGDLLDAPELAGA